MEDQGEKLRKSLILQRRQTIQKSSKGGETENLIKGSEHTHTHTHTHTQITTHQVPGMV